MNEKRYRGVILSPLAPLCPRLPFREVVAAVGGNEFVTIVPYAGEGERRNPSLSYFHRATTLLPHARKGRW